MPTQSPTRAPKVSGSVARPRKASPRKSDPAAPPPEAEDANARVRLLDAAEKLFADFGFNGVSTRQISEAAKVNQGGIPYYFGTKEGLLRAVFDRRIGPVQEERHTRMKALMEASKRPNVTEVLRALLEPAFRQSRKNDHFRRLAGRVATDPTPEVRRTLHSLYSPDSIYIHKALRAACPDLDDKDFYWRLYCVYGVMLYVQADAGKMQTIAGDSFDTSNTEVALKYVLHFLTAGIKAAKVR
jgi:AcrR family transcriptional regulator